jgi:hypothetical protein
VLLAALMLGCAVDAAPDSASDRTSDPAWESVLDSGAYTPALGTNVRTEQVDAFGFAVVVDGNGNGRVVGTLKNTENQPHAVTGASVKSDGTPVQTAVLADVIRLPSREPVDLTDAPPVSVRAANLTVGGFVELTLDVTDGELVQMLVPVEAQQGPYAGVDVIPVPDGTLPRR